MVNGKVFNKSFSKKFYEIFVLAKFHEILHHYSHDMPFPSFPTLYRVEIDAF